MTVVERFWSKVDKTGPNGCWVWTAGTNHAGYGWFGMSPPRQAQLAHRFSWELVHGPAGNDCVLHKCDNPPCCNPDHLFLGSRVDNNIDRDTKRRGVPCPGEANGRRKLTEAQVREIRRRAAAGETPKVIATAFGVSHQAVGHVARRETWAHVQ